MMKMGVCCRYWNTQSSVIYVQPMYYSTYLTNARLGRRLFTPSVPPKMPRSGLSVRAGSFSDIHMFASSRIYISAARKYGGTFVVRSTPYEGLHW